MKRSNTPDLLDALKPRQERPLKIAPSKTAAQIADDLEERGKKYIEAAKILRGRKAR